MPDYHHGNGVDYRALAQCRKEVMRQMKASGFMAGRAKTEQVRDKRAWKLYYSLPVVRVS